MYTHPIWEDLKNKARKKNPRVVLCEGDDERVLRAAEIITKEKLARLIIVGDKDTITRKAKSLRVAIDSIQSVDPLHNPDTRAIAENLYERRKTKGLTEEQAQELAETRLYCGFGLAAIGKADAVVSGAVETTTETVRAAMNCIGTAPGHKIITGLFLVETPHALQYGFRGGFVFGDCGVTPDPSPRMLAQIAREAADCFSFYFNAAPHIAFLSFSTYDSAAHERVDRVKEAVKITRKQFPSLVVDGELQLDAAVDRGIAERKKAGKSPVAGKANVLIFPDLDAGNITYKAVQRLGGARTIGPILWGMKKPASDLSRGCSVEDIVYTVCAVSASCKS